MGLVSVPTVGMQCFVWHAFMCQQLGWFGWRKFLCASKRFVGHTLFWMTQIYIRPDSDKVLGDAFVVSAVSVANDT